MATRQSAVRFGKKRGANKGVNGPAPSTKETPRGSVAKATVSGRKAIAKSQASTSSAKNVAVKRSAPLAAYNAKRDFALTSEPAGTVPRAKGAMLRFVIQKHAASHLHFDFRLELDGVMKSWAVPKGPSLDPSVKRLAMEVEDHPIAYNTFEGTIPQGEYGGGTVLRWDRGTYEADEGGDIAALRSGLKRGSLKIVLHGKRLRGAFVLRRMNKPGRAQWLLIKRGDEFADVSRDIVAEVTTSVASRRTMESIAKGHHVWTSED